MDGAHSVYLFIFFILQLDEHVTLVCLPQQRSELDICLPLFQSALLSLPLSCKNFQGRGELKLINCRITPWEIYPVRWISSMPRPLCVAIIRGSDSKIY